MYAKKKKPPSKKSCKNVVQIFCKSQ